MKFELRSVIPLLGTSLGAVVDGIVAFPVGVEADVSNGLPSFSIVGLPDSAVSESKQRIRAAIRNSGYTFPSKRITVNLTPANIRKRGAGLDLAIAIAILRASSQLPPVSSPSVAFCAELTLGGNLSPVPGLAKISMSLANRGRMTIVLSAEQRGQCLPVPNVLWAPMDTLSDVCQSVMTQDFHEHMVSDDIFCTPSMNLDYADVSGLSHAIRALEIAAVGKHHVLLVGPPGSGKTMLAERFATIFPPLTTIQAIEVYANHQSAGLDWKMGRTPPVRIPHHSLTVAGLIGGGNIPLPGEVTLANHGVLLLDELLEFPNQTLQALREPLTTRTVQLTRNGHFVNLPADFVMVCTLNPCPCGQRGFGTCMCSEQTIKRYWSKFSGPLLDRIDICVHVGYGPTQPKNSETSEAIRQRVTATREVRKELKLDLREGDLKRWSHEAKEVIRNVSDKLKISRRGIASVIRVADSIALLEGEMTIKREHAIEALGLRSQDSPV